MWNLIKNELEKMFYRKKILITFIILALMSGLVTYSYVRMNKSNAINNSPEVRLKNAQENLSNMENQKESGKMSERDKRYIDSDIENVKLEIENIKLQISSKASGDWRKSVEKNIEQLKDQKQHIDPLNNGSAIENLNVNINKLQYNLDHNIKPEEDYQSTGFGLLKALISATGFVFLAIIIGVLVSDNVSGEYTPPTMKVLLTRPVSRGKILFSKYVSAVISSILVVILVEFICFFIIGIVYGFGNIMSPMSVGTQYRYIKDMMQPGVINTVAIPGSTYIIPMWEFALRIIGLQMLFVVAAASFAFLLSTILKSSMISMAVNIVIIMVLSIVSTMPIIKKYAWLLFTSFGDVVGVVEKSMPDQFYGVKHFTVLNAVVVLTIWTVVCYVVSHITFRKKDMLI